MMDILIYVPIQGYSLCVVVFVMQSKIYP